MTAVTWPARRAGADRDILLCGRRDPGGRYLCRGVIAYLDDFGARFAGWLFPPGLVGEVDAEGVIYRETTRFRPGHSRWRRSQRNPWIGDGGPRFVGGRGPDIWRKIDGELPVRRLCPTCRTRALVTRDVLDS